MAYTLTIGGDDVTSILAAGARFREVASSGSGGAQFTLTGTRSSVVPGAAVTLTRNNVLLWEGTVSTSSPQVDNTAAVTNTLVTAVPLSAQFNSKAYFSVTQPVDVSTVFSTAAAQTTLSFSGGPYGFIIGPIGVTSAISSCLSVAALVAGGAWAVQSGALVFLSPELTAPTSLPIAFATTTATAGVIDVHGGSDAVTRAPIFKRANCVGSNATTVLHFLCPEAIGASTASAVADQLAILYGAGAISQTGLTLPVGTNLRAGTWCTDTNGIVMPAWDVTHVLIAGDIQDTVNFGYLPLAPASVNELDALAATRLSSDAIVQGCTGSIVSGLQFQCASGFAIIGSTIYAIPAATLTLPNNAVTQINITTTAFTQTTDLSFPDPGVAIPAFRVTTQGGQIIGVVSVAPNGTVQATTNVEFPGSIQLPDGSLTNVDGVSSATQYALASGQPITVSADIAMGATGSGKSSVIIAGNTTNGYGIAWDSAPNIYIAKWVGGAFSVISTTVSRAQDTAYHSLRLTVTPGSPNMIEGSIDGQYFSATDSSLTLTSGTWPVTLFTGGSTGKAQHYLVQATAGHYRSLPGAIKNVIDSSSNILSIEFPGGQINSNGELTSVDGASSHTQYTLSSGQPITISADIAKGVATGISELLLGIPTNGYYIQFYNGGASLAKVVAGTGSVIGNTVALTNDTNYHSYRLTVTPGSPNTIEGSIDGQYFSVTDSSLTLTSGPWPITLYTGGSAGKVQHYAVQATPLHIGRAIASATTFAKTKIPNFISNMIADVSMQFSTTVGGIKAWMAQASGSGQATWWSPDNPSAAYLAPTATQCGSSSSPLLNQTGLNSSTAYYIVATINPTTLNFTLTLYPSPPTDAQISAAVADGNILAVVASSSTGKSITPNSTSNGGFSGGGSGRIPQY